ncbi:hypothetical protein BDZ91DRAFT_796643 [Kalaharituber pfeilii]|nr:hypothetical protein BDZ91DRAFT_796643 [Kalaharituber pfeilii]
MASRHSRQSVVERSTHAASSRATSLPSSRSSSPPKPQRLKHSIASSGFFQEPPKLGNQYSDDLAFQRALSFYLPSQLSRSREFQQDLFRLAQFATSKRVAGWIDDAEKNLPTLEGKNIAKEEILEVWGRQRGAGIDKNGKILKTSEGWKKLGEWGGREGVVAIGYEGEFGPYCRVVQFAKYYLYSPSSALQTCPLAMTDGAARLLYRQSQLSPRSHLPTTPSSHKPIHLPGETHGKPQPGAKQVFEEAYKKLISRGGPDDYERWTSGQWMTERPGGSDVSNTETVAVYSPVTSEEIGELGLQDGDNDALGPWVISGYKFFPSAADANMTVLLARTEGSNGLSAFYAPLKRKALAPIESDVEGEEFEKFLGEQETWNGVRIVRLKKKLGTRPLATSEIELDGMRGWMIGEEGQGVKAISTILNITRVHNSVNAVAFMRRGLAIAKAFAQVRKISNRALAHTPLHLRTLSHLETVFRAQLHLTFLAVSLLGFDEHPEYISNPPVVATSTQQYIMTSIQSEPPNYLLPANGPGAVRALFLIVTPLAKALTAKASIAALAECMESLGGVDYLENEEFGGMNVQRLFRDANVLSIWEGTTNVLAVELVKSLLRISDVTSGLRGFNVVGEWVEANLGMGYHLPSGETREILERCKVNAWSSWTHLERRIGSRSREDLVASGRELIAWLGYVVCAVLLIVDARRDGDIIALETCRRWVLEGFGRGGMFAAGGAEDGGQEERRGKEEKWGERAVMDYHMTFGERIEKKLGEPKL